MKKGVLIAALVSICLTGCMKIGFAAANLPALFSSATVTRGIVFSTVPGLKLDVYVPKKKSKAPHDVLVFLYGGRWQLGSRDEYKFVADTFADRGYIVVIPDYRKYPRVKFPAFAEDAAAAIAWTHENIERMGGNPARIHIAGHSAGAHLAGLVAADESYLKKYGKDADKIIKSVAGLAGPYDFIPDEPDLQDMFGPPANYPNMRVTSFISGTEAPMLLLHGLKDKTVKIGNLERLAQKIKDKGGRVETKTYETLDHIEIMGALSWLGIRKPNVAADMDAFFKSVQ
ncbi:MAG: alpha/beta hydrolase [Proteobacteria bacterium]|nr:alpha/beta hydrolase [Pseudomonadota bacterium]